MAGHCSGKTKAVCETAVKPHEGAAARYNQRFMAVASSSRHYAAARAVCRRKFADVFFAAHFLPRPQRAHLFTLATVLDQLHQIMAGNDATSEEGGCGCDTPTERRRVAGRVLDHLCCGEPTGKAELDGFAELLAAYALPRALFDEMLDAMAAHHGRKRYATWRSLHEMSHRLAGSIALLGWSLLGASAQATTAAQVRSLGVAVHVTGMLLRLGAHGRAGRVLLPLEDLVRAGLSDRDILRFAEAQNDGGDERIRTLLRRQVDRLENLFTGGLKCVAALEDAAARRAVIVAVNQSLAQLDRMANGQVNVFGAVSQTTLWQRLRCAMQVSRLLRRRN